MDPNDIKFTLKTGSELNRPHNIGDLDSNGLNLIGLSMVFFEEAMKDSAKYCAIHGIKEISAAEIVMGLQAQLLRNDGKTFLTTKDLIQRSCSYVDLIVSDEPEDYDDDDDFDEEKEHERESIETMSEEEKQRLTDRFHYARTYWSAWHPDEQTNSMAFMMRQCIQQTIDKLKTAGL